MEPNKTNPHRGLTHNRGGRPKTTTDAVMVERAKRIRSALMLGMNGQQVCVAEGLSRGEYRATLKWMGRNWRSNSEAFGEFTAGAQNQIENIQIRINAILADAASSETEKGHLIVKFFRLMHEIRRDIFDMSLKMGMVSREAIKVDETRKVIIRFGDEGIVPWFAQQDAKVIEGEKLVDSKSKDEM